MREKINDVLDQHKRPVYQMVLAMVGNPHDAEEVSQEVFVKIFLNLEKFEGRASLSTWIYRIAQNTVKTFLVKRAIRSAISLDWMFENGEEGIVPDTVRFEDTIEQKSDNQVLFGELQTALMTLSFKLRQALVLREINELSYDEVAHVLGISVGTVKSRISRAKEALKESIQRSEKGVLYERAQTLSKRSATATI